MEVKNAIIEDVSLTTSERGLLTSYIHLDYGDLGHQGFGGYALYLPKSFKDHSNPGNFAGHFIFRSMEIAGVDNWKDMIGKTVRVKSDFSKVHAIGHIVKDDWFYPSEEFEKMNPKEQEA